MPKELPPHRDRGDGVCFTCYEEFPCTYMEEGWTATATIREWESEARDRARRHKDMSVIEKYRELVAYLMVAMPGSDLLKEFQHDLKRGEERGTIYHSRTHSVMFIELQELARLAAIGKEHDEHRLGLPRSDHSVGTIG